MIIFTGVIMVKIIYIEHDGTEHTVDVDVGTSIMEGAVSNSCLLYTSPSPRDRG